MITTAKFWTTLITAYPVMNVIKPELLAEE